MTEQELIQENEKLKARLQKAVVVFNEQKTTIARLTEERDDARNDLQKAQTVIAELETKANEASENDSKFFEQIQEIEDLKSEKETLNQQLEAERNEKKAAQEAHEEVQKTLNVTKSKVQSIQAEFTQRLQTMEESLAEMCNEVI